jgi:hypothetical protein
MKVKIHTGFRAAQAAIDEAPAPAKAAIPPVWQPKKKPAKPAKPAKKGYSAA